MKGVAGDAMSAEIPVREPTTTITIRQSTKKKLDRIGGGPPSYDDKVDAIADVILRERLVEKVRRRILGVDSTGTGGTGVSTEGRIIRVSDRPDDDAPATDERGGV